MNSNFDFVKNRKYYFIVSLILVLIGVVSLLTMGMNLGVDFKGGSRVQVHVGKTFSEEQIKKDAEQLGLKPGSVTTAGDNRDIAVIQFADPITKEDYAKLTKAMQSKYGKHVDLQQSTVDSMVSRELARSALYAVLIASIGIIIYITIRFEFKFAFAAVLALLHDAFLVITIFSLFHIEVDLPFIAAILTIVGYSINDTIVIFDRIRDNLKKTKIKKIQDIEDMVNLSIRQTLTRSINTVLTVLVCAIALFIFGGESIRSFTLALIIGLVFGAYSSIFIASQIWVSLKERELKKKKKLAPANNEA
ncbi:protein translocase subunit SecF [Aneurinibacillus thermoaerophilus]|uniref:Protein-export membrane protein SecF n=1 Tax=Aneurinibacillus thermoaerophilus TaxID=143495 RepID=A0A1G7YAV5_ANETH|nr:protein translocase subunit SecF [Aneurinibacillus thermoaerophilus]MED0755999.1 protein translocase subunit SecF [Aneurinibacillus thermoaerophilus]MED0759677.1 protein translocase subunit SecF [Aneurinibacillus thermoaerophilus]QYY42072.1 protein translocase subunit SecF [Aneurinibacillus thermoaerophilus]SDG93487.1 preprotein translocase subunit SecF [Aneurinibacillus thermoaerophilus]